MMPAAVEPAIARAGDDRLGELDRVSGALGLRSIMMVLGQPGIGRLLVCVPLAHPSTTDFAISRPAVPSCRAGIADSVASLTIRALE